VPSAETFVPSTLVLAICASSGELFDKVLSLWEKPFGPVEAVSTEYDFDFTRYYEKEMGHNLKKRLFAFEPLVETVRMVEIKKRAAEHEAMLCSRPGRRMANIDPGFVSRHRVLLVSRKDAPHRVPLTDGFYADLHLLYESGSFQPLEWTYPDFRIPEAVSFLNDTRDLWLEKMKQKRIPPPGG
jgi:hypothetical protein